MKLHKRIRGKKLPDGVVYIGRPTKWGNPYKVGEKGRTAKEATKLYAEHLDKLVGTDDFLKEHHLLGVRAHLKGKDLACWCGEWEPGQPEIDCHGVVLMKLANKEIDYELKKDSE